MRAVCALAGVLLALPESASFAQVSCSPTITLEGSSANDILTGTDGNDRITGNGGNDILSGLDGSDCLFSGSFNDQLFGGEGNDRLAAEGGEDLLDGGPGDDEMNGGSGKDTLVGGPGQDAIAGEGDDDTFRIHAGDVPTGGTETLNGGSGVDTVVLDFDPGPVEPPAFVVIDPVTGGRYRFFDTEQVEVRACGNGELEPREVCDDGNTVSGDGCDANCTPTGCGNGIVTAGEECDDGNLSDGDGCSAECQREPDDEPLPPAVCGDGIVSGAEDCDDGNLTDGDGCSAICGHECTSAAQCDDGDPCTADACEGGACVSTRLEPFANAICRTGALSDLPACRTDRLGAKLRLPGRVQRLQSLLRRAGRGEGRDPLGRAEHILAGIHTKGTRLAGREKISPGCARSLDRHMAEAAGLVAELRASPR